MNIHPIFVHFPIVLLSLYSIMELFQFKKVLAIVHWRALKVGFLVLGVLTSLPALQTGDMAESIVGHSSLIELHSNLATISVIYFVIVAVPVIVLAINNESAYLKNWFWNTRYLRTVWMPLSKLVDKVSKLRTLWILIGIVGLILITLTGALGGAIVYGPNADPVVSSVYNLFF